MSRVTVLAFRPTRSLDQASGLLGFVRIDVGDLRLDGVAVRRALDGRYVLSFPSRRDRQGVEHSTVSPLTVEIGRDIEAQVVATLRAWGELR